MPSSRRLSSRTAKSWSVLKVINHAAFPLLTDSYWPDPLFTTREMASTRWVDLWNHLSGLPRRLPTSRAFPPYMQPWSPAQTYRLGIYMRQSIKPTRQPGRIIGRHLALIKLLGRARVRLATVKSDCPPSWSRGIGVYRRWTDGTEVGLRFDGPASALAGGVNDKGCPGSTIIQQP